MKRQGNLWPAVTSFENLLLAAHKAQRGKRFTHFARHNRYVLQCDIQKYFPSIDRTILKSQLHRKIKCPETKLLT